jgi:hypothetical protein
MTAAAASAEQVVAAWGAFAEASGRATEVARTLNSRALCLGVTSSGAPRHPLYARASSQLRPWIGTREPPAF